MVLHVFNVCVVGKEVRVSYSVRTVVHSSYWRTVWTVACSSLHPFTSYPVFSIDVDVFSLLRAPAFGVSFDVRLAAHRIREEFLRRFFLFKFTKDR